MSPLVDIPLLAMTLPNSGSGLIHGPTCWFRISAPGEEGELEGKKRSLPGKEPEGLGWWGATGYRKLCQVSRTPGAQESRLEKP